MSDLIAAAGISAGAGVLSNLFGNSANANLNAKNRAWQEKMQDKQYQYQLDFFNRSNAYNSPTAQKERLLAAGLNPDVMFSNGAGSVGNSTMPSAPSAGSPGSVPYDFSGIGNSVSSAANLYFQSQLSSAQAQKATSEAKLSNIDTLTRLQSNIADIKAALSTADKNSTEAKTLQQNLKLAQATYDEQVKSISLNNGLMQAQTEDSYSHASLNTILGACNVAENSRAERLITAQVQSLYATISNIQSSTTVNCSIADMNKQQTRLFASKCKEVAVNILKTVAETNNIKWDSLTKSKTLSRLDDVINAEIFNKRGMPIAIGGSAVINGVVNWYTRGVANAAKAAEKAAKANKNTANYPGIDSPTSNFNSNSTSSYNPAW